MGLVSIKILEISLTLYTQIQLLLFKQPCFQKSNSKQLSTTFAFHFTFMIYILQRHCQLFKTYVNIFQSLGMSPSGGTMLPRPVLLKFWCDPCPVLCGQSRGIPAAVTLPSLSKPFWRNRPREEARQVAKTLESRTHLTVPALNEAQRARQPRADQQHLQHLPHLMLCSLHVGETADTRFLFEGALKIKK